MDNDEITRDIRDIRKAEDTRNKWDIGNVGKARNVENIKDVGNVRDKKLDRSNNKAANGRD